MILLGFPATTQKSGTSLVITVFATITQLQPILTFPTRKKKLPVRRFS